MNEKLKGYIMLAILLSLPLLREYSTNGTVDALIGIVVWTLMLFILFAGVCFAGAGLIFYGSTDDITGLDKMKAAYKPIKKMRWWKSLLTGTLTLGVYAYVDWTGPAVCYFIGLMGLWWGAYLLRKAITEAMEKAGIVADVEPSEDLSKSRL